MKRTYENISNTTTNTTSIEGRNETNSSTSTTIDPTQLKELIRSCITELRNEKYEYEPNSTYISQIPQRFGYIPFKTPEEVRTNEFLTQKLTKDHLTRRPGPGGRRLTYIESCKAIELANQAFGFNGWSCKVLECKEEYRSQRNDRWSIGFSALVRIELKDGTSHEDVGFGQADGQRDFGAAIEQAKKACISDARKRALRLFGEYLGNSCYDREHIKDVHNAPRTSIAGNSYPAAASRTGDNVAQQMSSAQPQTSSTKYIKTEHHGQEPTPLVNSSRPTVSLPVVAVKNENSAMTNNRVDRSAASMIAAHISQLHYTTSEGNSHFEANLSAPKNQQSRKHSNSRPTAQLTQCKTPHSTNPINYNHPTRPITTNSIAISSSNEFDDISLSQFDFNP